VAISRKLFNNETDALVITIRRAW